MKTSNHQNIFNSFLSSEEGLYEAVDDTTVQARKFALSDVEVLPDVETYGVVLNFESLSDYLNYLVQLHLLEPIFYGANNLMFNPKERIDPDTVPNMTYAEFLTATYVNSDYTFNHSPVVFKEPVALSFYDRSLLGQVNTYAPFGIIQNNTINCLITADTVNIRKFYNSTFKDIYYKGNIQWLSTVYYSKGSIIYITDKSFYILIIGFEIEAETGLFRYKGIIVI